MFNLQRKACCQTKMHKMHKSPLHYQSKCLLSFKDPDLSFIWKAVCICVGGVSYWFIPAMAAHCLQYKSSGETDKRKKQAGMRLRWITVHLRLLTWYQITFLKDILQLGNVIDGLMWISMLYHTVLSNLYAYVPYKKRYCISLWVQVGCGSCRMHLLQ